MTREKKIAYINMKAKRQVVQYYWNESGIRSRKLYIKIIEEEPGFPFHFTTSHADQKIAVEIVDLMFEEAIRKREVNLNNDDRL